MTSFVAFLSSHEVTMSQGSHMYSKLCECAPFRIVWRLFLSGFSYLSEGNTACVRMHMHLALIVMIFKKGRTAA